MQWLIFGATGYTGSALLSVCLEQGHGVWAHVRPDSNRRQWIERRCATHDNVSINVLDFEPDAIEDLITQSQATHIALCLGTTRKQSKLAQKSGQRFGYNGIDRDLSLMVIDAAIRCASSARICYVSSMGADKPRGNAYLQARYDVEQALMSSGKEYIIVRPAFISGPDRHSFRLGERVGAVLGDSILGLGGLLGFKKTEIAYRSMDGEELAKGICAAAERADVAQLLYPQHLRHQIKMRYD